MTISSVEALVAGLDLSVAGNWAAWTPGRVEALRRLWKEGLSASQIAGRLGKVTRNAVIGKVHRLGLACSPARRENSGAGKVRAAVAKRAVRKAGLAPPRFACAPAPVEEAPECAPTLRADGAPHDVLSIREGLCKFILGDPRERGAVFCGAACEAGPYCPRHTQLCYQGGAARKKASGEGAAQAAAHRATLRQLESAMAARPRGWA